MFSLCLTSLIGLKKVSIPDVPSGLKKGDLFVGYEETSLQSCLSGKTIVRKEPKVFEVDTIHCGDLSFLSAFVRSDLSVTEEDINMLERQCC